MMAGESIGDAVEQVERTGWLDYIGPDGRVWRLRYIGEIPLGGQYACDG